ncbi:MAG: hypothetical protein Kow0098_15670 [Ignavibacteriaceae bacterium]
MLSDKLKLIFFSLLILLSACESKRNVEPVRLFDDNEFIKKKARELLGEDTKFAVKGIFNSDSLIEIAAATEIETDDKWGIRFSLLQRTDDGVVVKYQSDLLDGSLRECFIDKIKMVGFDKELLYYNSGSFFMGSGGGEIYAYVVNFKDNSVYSARLVAEPGRPVLLYLSDNISSPELRTFFGAVFRKDYPSLRVVGNVF